MRKYFYARVSSKDQSLERQLLQAKANMIEDDFIFIEKASGKDFARPEYQLLKRILREKDILIYQVLLQNLRVSSLEEKKSSSLKSSSQFIKNGKIIILQQ